MTTHKLIQLITLLAQVLWICLDHDLGRARAYTPGPARHNRLRHRSGAAVLGQSHHRLCRPWSYDSFACLDHRDHNDHHLLLKLVLPVKNLC